jgi:hypothetical protein
MKIKTTPNPASAKPHPSFFFLDPEDELEEVDGVDLDLLAAFNDLLGCSKARANCTSIREINKSVMNVDLLRDIYFDKDIFNYNFIQKNSS